MLIQFMAVPTTVYTFVFLFSLSMYAFKKDNFPTMLYYLYLFLNISVLLYFILGQLRVFVLPLIFIVDPLVFLFYFVRNKKSIVFFIALHSGILATLWLFNILYIFIV